MRLLLSPHSSPLHLPGSSRRSKGAAAMLCRSAAGFGKAPSSGSLLFLGREQLPLAKEEKFW